MEEESAKPDQSSEWTNLERAIELRVGPSSQTDRDPAAIRTHTSPEHCLPPTRALPQLPVFTQNGSRGVLQTQSQSWRPLTPAGCKSTFRKQWSCTTSCADPTSLSYWLVFPATTFYFNLRCAQHTIKENFIFLCNQNSSTAVSASMVVFWGRYKPATEAHITNIPPSKSQDKDVESQGWMRLRWFIKGV